MRIISALPRSHETSWLMRCSFTFVLVLVLLARATIAAHDGAAAEASQSLVRSTRKEKNSSENSKNSRTAPPSPPPSNQSSGNCTRCRLHEATINLTKEAIKQQILSKLGLSSAPNTTGRVLPNIPPLNQLLDYYGMQGDAPSTPFHAGPVFEVAEDDYHARTQILMVMAKDPPSSFGSQSKVQYFTLASGAKHVDRVVRAKLWFYTWAPKDQPNKPLNAIVHHVMTTKDAEMVLSHYRTQSIRVEAPGKWVDIDIDKLVIDWIARQPRELGIVVHVFDKNGVDLVNNDRTAANGTLVPYIEIHTTEEKKRRQKRMIGLNCEENSNEIRCCRYPLTVDFEEFGWDWIIAPKKYEANYCSGECPFVFLQKYPHTHLVQQTNPSGSAGPCCAPRKMSPISMLYFDDNNNIIYGLLPGMVVDHCGCS